MQVQTLTSNAARIHFSDTLGRAQTNPLTLTRRGEPVVTMMNAQLAHQALSLYRAHDMARFLNDLPSIPTSLELSEEDNNALVHALR